MFKLSAAANEWFDKLKKQHPFKEAPLMHIYYSCALIGMYSKTEIKTLEDGENFLSRGLPAQYANNNFIPIIAAFLEVEIERFKINRDDKKAVKEHLTRYINSESDNKLTSFGLESLDNYSFTGYLKIKQKLREKPELMNVYLIEYSRLLNSYFD